MFSLSDYRYTLPKELIAQEAIHPHHDARMMVVDKKTGRIESETIFWNLDSYLDDDRVMFFNDSRVLRSRIVLKDTPYFKGDKTTGILGNGEIFYLSGITDISFEALVRPGNKFKIGTIFTVGEYEIEVVAMTENGRVLRIQNLLDGIPGGTTSIIHNFLEKHGSLPLPPYIEYNEKKEVDYQTSFAKNDGSVAAPTASLHFTKELMDRLSCQKEYITLHVGLGTFKGIQTPDIRDYNIHAEKIEISKDIFQKIAHIKENGKRIVAVGTTATRTLESLPYIWKKINTDIQNTIDAKTRKYWNTLTKDLIKQEWIDSIEIDFELGTLNFETSIYITPGYEFLMVDDMITNFHLSESSLLVLVSAFLGYEHTKKIYEYAISSQYRFYSFGDGMYIRGKSGK